MLHFTKTRTRRVRHQSLASTLTQPSRTSLPGSFWVRAVLSAAALATVWHVDVVDKHQLHAGGGHGLGAVSAIYHGVKNWEREHLSPANHFSHQRSDDLFYNYYTDPGSRGSQPAQLYISPRPTPPHVGHTYYTYQPLLPHEMLYRHHRTYWAHQPYGGWNRTRVTYGHSVFGSLPLGWLHSGD